MFAFLFSKIGLYLVGTVLIVALVGGGYLYIGHLKKQAAKAEARAAAAELKVEITEKALEAATKTKAAQAKVRQQNVQNRKEVEEVVESGDRERLRAIYERYGVRIPKIDTSPGGPGSHPGDILRRAPDLPSVHPGGV
jgi:uncharacterized protein YbaP (TraB family)